MNQVNAKVYVESVTKNEHNETPTMRPVTGGTPEDNNYSKATPGGELRLCISNPECFGFFKPGKKYFVTFTEAAE